MEVIDLGMDDIEISAEHAQIRLLLVLCNWNIEIIYCCRVLG